MYWYNQQIHQNIETFMAIVNCYYNFIQATEPRSTLKTVRRFDSSSVASQGQRIRSINHWLANRPTPSNLDYTIEKNFCRRSQKTWQF